MLLTSMALYDVLLIASNGDEEIAENMAEGCMAVGKDGTISIEDSHGVETTLEFKEGMEIAKKLKLPRRIKDSIEQHHGTSLVKYFFEKAKEEYDPEMQTVGEESYRYPGPVPKNKESALVMLADSIEAATRSLKKPTEQNIKRLITDIFNHKIEDGQLDECDFSLRDLRKMANSFASTLYSIYHPRIEYPGFDFEPKTKKNNNNKAKQKTKNDRNHKPPEQVLDQDGDV